MKILKYISTALLFLKSLISKKNLTPNKGSNSLLSLINSKENETLFI
jgi:hypothetical protein